MDLDPSKWTPDQSRSWYHRLKLHLVDPHLTSSHHHYLFRSGLPLIETQTAIYTNNAIPDNADGQVDRMDMELLVRSLHQAAEEEKLTLREPIYLIDINLMGQRDPRDVLREATEEEYFKNNPKEGVMIRWQTSGVKERYEEVKERKKKWFREAMEAKTRAEGEGTNREKKRKGHKKGQEQKEGEEENKKEQEAKRRWHCERNDTIWCRCWRELGLSNPST